MKLNEITHIDECKDYLWRLENLYDKAETIQDISRR